MEYETVLLEKKEGVAKITLNRPQKMNAVNFKLLDELLDATREIARDEGVKAVILTGAGKAFCSGVDIAILETEEAVPNMMRIMDRVTRIALGFRNTPKPFVAAVNGAAMGLGCGLALACDMSIASEEARFAFAFVLRGLHPDTASTYFLPKAVGLVRARELLLTGRTIDSREAERIGMVNRVVPPDRLEAEARDLARSFARGPSMDLGMVKTSIYQILGMDLASALECEARAQCICATTEDVREAVRAWMEKRPPVFKGK